MPCLKVFFFFFWWWIYSSHVDPLFAISAMFILTMVFYFVFVVFALIYLICISSFFFFVLGVITKHMRFDARAIEFQEQYY